MSCSICCEMSTACRFSLKPRQDFDQAAQELVAGDQQEKQHQQRREGAARRRCGPDAGPFPAGSVPATATGCCPPPGARLWTCSRARLHDLIGLAQKIQRCSCMRGKVCGSWAISCATGPDSSSPTTTKRLTSDSTMISAAKHLRQADAQQQPHDRLEHRAQHEGEHDRQYDLGRDIAGREHRQQQQAAEEYRPELDARCPTGPALPRSRQSEACCRHDPTICPTRNRCSGQANLPALRRASTRSLTALPLASAARFQFR